MPDKSSERPFARISTFIKSKREAMGLSQTDVFEKINAPSRNYISNLESGRKDVRNSSYFKDIAKILHFSPQELYELIMDEPIPASLDPSFREGDFLLEVAHRSGKTAVGMYPNTVTSEELKEPSIHGGILIQVPAGIFGRLIALETADAQMSPYLDPGDIAIIELGANPVSPSPGDKILVRTKPQAPLLVRSFLGFQGSSALVKTERATSSADMLSNTALLGKVVARIKYDGLARG